MSLWYCLKMLWSPFYFLLSRECSFFNLSSHIHMTWLIIVVYSFWKSWLYFHQILTFCLSTGYKHEYETKQFIFNRFIAVYQIMLIMRNVLLFLLLIVPVYAPCPPDLSGKIRYGPWVGSTLFMPCFPHGQRHISSSLYLYNRGPIIIIMRLHAHAMESTY